MEAAVRALRARADRKDEPFFASRAFDGTREFYERFLRLGAVFVLGEAAAALAAPADAAAAHVAPAETVDVTTARGETGEARASLWLNRSARMQLPPGAARACLLALGEA